MPNTEALGLHVALCGRDEAIVKLRRQLYDRLLEEKRIQEAEDEIRDLQRAGSSTEQTRAWRKGNAL